MKQPKKQSAHYQVINAIGWLEHALLDFIEGRTQSVSGNDNAYRLATALRILQDLDRELKACKSDSERDELLKS